jgi:hypothetical protein
MVAGGGVNLRQSASIFAFTLPWPIRRSPPSPCKPAGSPWAPAGRRWNNRQPAAREAEGFCGLGQRQAVAQTPAEKFSGIFVAGCPQRLQPQAISAYLGAIGPEQAVAPIADVHAVCAWRFWQGQFSNGSIGPLKPEPRSAKCFGAANGAHGIAVHLFNSCHVASIVHLMHHATVGIKP